MTVYKFTLKEDFTLFINSKSLKNVDLKYNDKNGILRLSIANQIVTIHSTYSWDGCTPKYKLFGNFIIGTWDGFKSKRHTKPQCFYPSLVHDIFYQFLYKDGFPLTRKETDKIFFDMMNQEKFIFRTYYYIGVRMFGKFVPRLVKYFNL